MVENTQITILTMGSRGDVEPYVALGKGLHDAGHIVRIATHDNFKDLVIDRGMEHFSVEGNPQEMLEQEAGRRWLETGQRMNPFTFVKRMMDAAGPIIRGMLDDYVKACQGTDLILTSTLSALAAVSLGEKLNVRVLPAYLQHVHNTRLYAALMSVPKPKLGGLYNLLTYPLGSMIYWQMLRPHINRWRRESLKIPGFSLRGPFSKSARQRYDCLYGFSPAVVPRAPEWGDNIYITGYWFLEKSSQWQPPADLLEFLKSGEPPVFVGFSSMTNREPEAVTRIVIEALKKAGQRGIIATGWGGLSDIDLPENIFRIDYAPFDWLFPRMAAVVHHGGAGTTATGLRAGVPSIVVPFFADQFFWGWRVSELGVGPQAIPRKKLTAERLAVAIGEAVSNSEMRHRAAELGERIRTEDGVANAVTMIEQFLAKP